jgi:hypothetical protein
MSQTLFNQKPAILCPSRAALARKPVSQRITTPLLHQKPYYYIAVRGKPDHRRGMAC